MSKSPRQGEVGGRVVLNVQKVQLSFPHKQMAVKKIIAYLKDPIASVNYNTHMCTEHLQYLSIKRKESSDQAKLQIPLASCHARTTRTAHSLHPRREDNFTTAQIKLAKLAFPEYPEDVLVVLAVI